MFGAETQLMERAENQEIFASIVHMINRFKHYFNRYDQPIYENPSPGNKKGGISTMEEKSLGCVQKSGKATVADVLDYGGTARKSGLNLLIGPGNDQMSCTNLTASGANIVIFTTGRGNPYGAPVPTIKLASNSKLAQYKNHWIDYDAGVLLNGAAFEETAEDFFQYILDVASGRKQTNNEKHAYKEISVFRDGVIL
jgi:altronate hydrolase